LRLNVTAVGLTLGSAVRTGRIPIESNLIMKTETLILPLLLLAAAIFLEVVTRTVALADNHRELAAFYDSQETQYKIAVDLRTQFQGIATETAKLAEGGNSNAVTVMERLKTAGISVQLPADPDAGTQESKP